MQTLWRIRRVRPGAVAAGLAVGGAVAAVATPESGQNGALARAMRASVTAARLGTLYSWASMRAPQKSESAFSADAALKADRSRLQTAHEKGAAWVRRTCELNGGVYVKLGQMLAQLDHLLPLVYIDALRPLLDACPAQTWDTVRKVIAAESPRLLAEADIQPKPVATASLAQVHRATLKEDGAQIAIKIQHDGLKKHSMWDIRVIQGLLMVGARWFELLRNMEWLGEELESSLRDELDFTLEAQNCAACAQNLSASDTTRGKVVAPVVAKQYSTSNLLVMSWENGVAVDDVAGIRQLGLKPSDVSKLLCYALAEQIFVHGHVHCDPHAANVRVRRRDDSPTEPQLVLLDHGLYRRLDPGLRLQYANLWQAIARGDRDDIYQFAKSLGVSGEHNVKMLAMMLTLRPWDIIEMDRTVHNTDSAVHSLVRGADEISDDVRKRVQDFVLENNRSIGEVLNAVPRELLLLFKTSDCVRAIERRLGANWSWLEVTARVSARVVADHERLMAHQRVESASSSSWWSLSHLTSRATLFMISTRLAIERAVLEVRLALFSAISSASAQPSVPESSQLETETSIQAA